MSTFKSFNEKQIHMIISIPYRAGVWIGGVDDVDGLKDDHKEQKALLAILRALEDSKHQHEFVKKIMFDILHATNMWPVWSKREAKFLDDCAKVIKLLHKKAGKDVLTNYQRAVWQVASVVAQAHKENTDPDDIPEALILQFADEIAEKFSKPTLSLSHPENVSDIEKKALAQLKLALQGKTQDSASKADSKKGVEEEQKK